MENEYFRVKIDISNEIKNDYRLIEIIKELAILNTQLNNLERYQLNKFSNLSNNFILLSILKIDEVVSTAQIEGSNITVNEVEKELLTKRYKRFNIIDEKFQEILNSLNLLKDIKSVLNKYSLSTRLFKYIHKSLFKDLPSFSSFYGKYRKNLIFIKNSVTNEIIFKPVDVNKLNNELNDFEKFINKKPINEIEAIINSGIAHAWFERIHPFFDGNGRVGRFLIPFYFMNHNLVDEPIILLSYKFKESQSKYYDSLKNIDQTKNYDEWLKYYFDVLYISIKKINSFLREIDEFINNLIEKLKKSNEKYISTNAKYIARILFKNRSISIRILEDEIKKLIDKGILSKIPSPIKMNDYIHELKRILDLEIISDKPIILFLKKYPKIFI